VTAGNLSEGEWFEELYREHWALVFALCRARLGDPDEAADAAQEVFVRKWARFGSYDPARASFRTWVSVNTEHRIIDIIRQRRTRRREEPVSDDLEAPDPEQVPAEQGPVLAAVARALTALGPRQRQLVLMKKLHGYTWEEIAAFTGLTVAQARAEVGRAASRLRALLAQEGLDPGS
jgi:RNA polymerase sigma-70 factor (ECF subfamily)